jgi:hypothetical protein
MVSKLQLFSIFSFLHALLDTHKKFNVGEEPIKKKIIYYNAK